MYRNMIIILTGRFVWIQPCAIFAHISMFIYNYENNQQKTGRDKNQKNMNERLES